MVYHVVGGEGLEPSSLFRGIGPQPIAYANSATRPQLSSFYQKCLLKMVF